jgi:hypothetical protein
MKTINYYMLEANGACSDHLNIFRDTFGDGEVKLSRKNLKIALDMGLDISFLKHFLSGVAWTEYDRVLGGAQAEHDRVVDGALTEYDRVCDAAWAEYDRVCDEAWDEYRRVWAEALIDLLNRDTP